MKKQIIRTIETGKATIEVTMTYYNETSNLDGHVNESKSIAKLVAAKLIVDGKEVAKSSEGFIYAVDGEKGRFSNGYLPIAMISQILELIEEMHKELSEEFEIKTNTEIAAEEEIEEAKTIMSEIKNRETEILSEIEEKIWRTNYNNINNEGGEGYAPSRATLEDVEKAKAILA